MALNTNALITVDTYTKAARVPQPGTDSELLAQAEFAINAASDYVETECGCTFLSGSKETEVFSGLGYNDVMSYAHTSYKLQHAPITTSPHAPRLYNYSSGVWTLVSVDSFTYDATEGVIYFAGSSDYEGSSLTPGQLGGSGYYFENGKNNYKVEYYYGYDGRANIPVDLQMAVAIIAKLMVREIDYVGITSETSENVSRGFSFGLPIIVQTIINKYKRD